MEFILDVIVQNNIPPKENSDMCSSLGSEHNLQSLDCVELTGFNILSFKQIGIIRSRALCTFIDIEIIHIYVT